MFHAQQSVGELLDWSLDWTPTLDGATAVSSTWSVSPSAGMTLANASLVDSVATIFVSSDQPGQIFIVTNTLSTGTDVYIEKVEFWISP